MDTQHRDIMVKSQSAMEYLMTYGWAILIIAVVLSVLFQLGVFSSGNFQPHAQAGSCQVSRTAAGVSLEGQCNGLLPEFVGKSTGQYASIPDSSTIDSAVYNFTVSFWLKANSQYPGGCCWSVVNKGWGVQTRQWYFIAADNGGGSIRYGVNTITTTVEQDYSWNDYNWHFITGTFSQGTMTLYVDGEQKQQTSGMGVPVLTNTESIWILSQLNGGCGGDGCYSGDISNLQIYNVSLSPPEVNSLYLEGIGGAPIRPQNLVGWWPMNGNMNDYSGNNNNGQTYNGAFFTSSWESGYTAP